MNDFATTDAVAPETPAEPADTETNDAESDADLVQRAKDCYRAGIDATANWRAAASEDTRFVAGEQWDANIKSMRENQGRPALTNNRLPQFLRQVTNEQRQSRPAMTVSPVDDASDVKTGEVLQGVIRNIEYTSNADAAYATAGQTAAITGLGFWDVCAEYEDERSFEQRLTIKRITNPLSVVMDPGAKELAGDDARWTVHSTDLSEGEWKSLCPGKEMPKSTGWEGQGDVPASWVAENGVRIHEFRYITEEPDTLIQVPDGALVQLPPGMFGDVPEGGLVLASEMDPAVAQLLAGAAVPGGPVLESELKPDVAQALLAMDKEQVPRRPTTRRKACWAKIAGDEVVKKGEFAGKYLQLVRVVGTEIDSDGEMIYEGIVRHAKDPQRMHNYYVTAEAEAIALTPKAPWLLAEGQDEGHEDEWAHANQRALSRLIWKPTSLAGQPVPPPQRVMAEANVAAITNARVQSAEDLKAVTGIYDAALGARSNETSGIAIRRREAQGQTANFHFQDNLGVAIRLTGRILIDLIPKIYSGPRVLRMLGEDGKHEMVPVNGHPGEFRGEPSTIDLNAGRYDVTVSMGPSYHSRRQETAAMLQELSARSPQLMAVAGDLIIKTLDIPGGNEIAKRMEKALPPELRPQDEKQPPPQVLAQQLQEHQQMVDQLTAQLNEAKNKLETNAQDNEAKKAIEMAKLDVEIFKTMATLDSKENVAQFAALARQAERISARLGLSEAQPTNGAQQ